MIYTSSNHTISPYRTPEQTYPIIVIPWMTIKTSLHLLDYISWKLYTAPPRLRWPCPSTGCTRPGNPPLKNQSTPASPGRWTILFVMELYPSIWNDVTWCVNSIDARSHHPRRIGSRQMDCGFHTPYSGYHLRMELFRRIRVYRKC